MTTNERERRMRERAKAEIVRGAARLTLEETDSKEAMGRQTRPAPLPERVSDRGLRLDPA